MTLINKKHIVVFGTVTPNNVGDALQQIVALHLVKKFLPSFNVTLMAPSISRYLGANLEVPYVDSNAVRLFATYNAIKDKLLRHRHLCNYNVEGRSPITDLSTSLYNIYTRALPYVPPISEIDKWTALSTLRGCSYSAGFIAGHTISSPSIYHYVFSYEILRKLVKGPIITFPLSISINAFKILSEWNKRHVVKKLKHILHDSYVFVRGPITLRFMKEVIGLENVEMALDSGFGIRDLIFFNVYARQQDKEYAVIAPRRDLHHYYGEIKQYRCYLNLIANIIIELMECEDCHVYLVTPTGSLDTIRDVLLELHRKNLKFTKSMIKRISIVKLANLIDACKLLSSAKIVITSYMHIGVISMSFGAPTLFFQPVNEIKLLDIFCFLGIPPLIIDIFNVHFMRKMEVKDELLSMLDKAKTYGRLAERKLEEKYFTLYNPVRSLVKNSP